MTIRDLIDSGKISLDTAVLGELPMTADGVMVFPGAFLWCVTDSNQVMGFRVLCLHGSGPDGRECDPLWNRCWTTSEAAERAAKEACSQAAERAAKEGK